MTASEKITILVKSRGTTGEKFEALKVFLVVVAFIGSFAFATLGKYASPGEDDTLSSSILAYLSLFFLSGSTAILLYIAVVGTLTVSCAHRVRNLAPNFLYCVSTKMQEKIKTRKNVEINFCSGGEEKKWQIKDHGSHLVTFDTKNENEAKQEIKDIVQDSVHETFLEHEKHYNVLFISVMFWDLNDYREIREKRKLFRKWYIKQKNLEKEKKLEELKKEINNQFEENSQFYELSKVKESEDYEPYCLYYTPPIKMYGRLFWGWQIRRPIRWFPYAIVSLMAGQALDICSEENAGTVEIVILAVWFVPFSIMVLVIGREVLLSLLTR